MEITIKSYKDNQTDFMLLCGAAASDVNNPARDNHSADRPYTPGSVHRQIDSGLYNGQTGDYNLLYYDRLLVGGAGYYRYDDEYVLGCTRAYVMPEWRKRSVTSNLVIHHLMASRGLSPKMMITFNGYNERIYRARMVRPGLIPEIWSSFRPLGKRIINYTEQYCWEREIDAKPNV